MLYIIHFSAGARGSAGCDEEEGKGERRRGREMGRERGEGEGEGGGREETEAKRVLCD